MKKIIFVVAVFIIGIVAIVMTHQDSIEETIQQVSQYKIEILAIEKKDNEYCVVYRHEDLDDLSFAILDRTILGYNISYTGTMGEVSITSEKQDISHMDIPLVRDLKNSYIIGMIGNEDITDIRVFDSKGQDIKANIIDSKSGRIYVATTTPLAGDEDLIIKGYSDNGTEVSEVST